MLASLSVGTELTGPGVLERCGPHNSFIPVSAGSGSSSEASGQLGLFNKRYIPEACRRISEEVTVLQNLVIVSNRSHGGHRRPKVRLHA